MVNVRWTKVRLPTFPNPNFNLKYDNISRKKYKHKYSRNQGGRLRRLGKCALNSEILPKLRTLTCQVKILHREPKIWGMITGVQRYNCFFHKKNSKKWKLGKNLRYKCCCSFVCSVAAVVLPVALPSQGDTPTVIKKLGKKIRKISRKIRKKCACF